MDYAKEVRRVGNKTIVTLFTADGNTYVGETTRNPQDADNPLFAEELAEYRAKQGLELKELYAKYGM